MWTTPVARTDTAPRYSAARARVDRCRVVKPRGAEAVVALVGLALIRVSLSGSKARNGSLQRGGLPVPTLDWGCSDYHRRRPSAGHETCDLAVGGLRGRVG